MTEGYPPAWQYDVSTAGAHAAPASVYPEPIAVPTDPGFAAADDTDDSADQSKAGAAKEQAAAVGQVAAEAGQQVASVAKDQAQNVVAEAGSQAKDLVGQARSELTDQAASQQKRLAAGLRALGDELESMTHHSEQPGVATDLAKQASTRAHDAASWLDDREPGHLLQELQTFARQKPGTFLALAAAAGLLAGRLGRGVKDAGSADTASSASSAGADDAGYPVESVATFEPESARPFASSQDSDLQQFPAAGGSL
jgi:hypothetical protein